MVTFILANPERKTSSINMLVTLNGKKYKKSVRESVPVRLWNNTRKRVKETTTFPEGSLINDRINKWDAAGLRAYSHYKGYRTPPTLEQFFHTVEDEYYKDERNTPQPMMLLEYCDVYIKRYTPVRAESTIRKFTTVKHTLERYQKEKRRKLYFEDIDINFYNDFQKWFYDQGLADNYFGSQIKIVKQMYAEARDQDHLHKLNGTDHKEFITVNVEADAVYLSEEELRQIYNLELTPELIRKDSPTLSDLNVSRKIESLTLTRNRFLIGAYSGLRVSDFARLNSNNVTDFIRIMAHKSKFNTVIPIHPIIKEILASGFDLNETISDQKINDQLKELARLAGITQPVNFFQRKGGKVESGIFPKNELISTHTARRSFATNAYLAGVPTLAIMKITGHKKESSFMRYIRVSAQQNAELLEKHPFFSKEEVVEESAVPNAVPNDSDEIENTV